ncbi:MAG: hypothetical protein GXP33_11565 [Spirochaetes bacterium]|nr:hypothetical protein [Spirochaetota bacterium]
MEQTKNTSKLNIPGIPEEDLKFVYNNAELAAKTAYSLNRKLRDAA